MAKSAKTAWQQEPVRDSHPILTRPPALTCDSRAQACTYEGVSLLNLLTISNAFNARPGPNFKRGPPKGYIHAIEQRWQQVECILGALMTAPRAQNVVAELRGDPFARAVLDRVDAGPYASTPPSLTSDLTSDCGHRVRAAARARRPPQATTSTLPSWARPTPPRATTGAPAGSRA